MEPIRHTIAGIDFAFEDLKSPLGFTWMITAENVAFMIFSEDGKAWEFKGKVSVWLQELKPRFIQVIKEQCSLPRR